MTVLTKAYILKISSRGDYDRQYGVFSQELGKIQVLAKGAAKITSKLSGHLDFFCLTEIMVARGVNFFRLAGAKINQSNKKIREDFFKCLVGKVFVEALDLLLPEGQSEAPAFAVTESFFYSLNESLSERDSHLILNIHLYKLLSVLGYQPELSAQNQKDLSADLAKKIEQASDRQLNGFAYLAKMF